MFYLTSLLLSFLNCKMKLVYISFSEITHVEQLAWYLIDSKAEQMLPIIFPGSSDHKQSVCNERDLGSIPGSGRSPGEGIRQPTPVFLPEKSHEQRSLVGYSPWGHKELGMTESLTLEKAMAPHSSTLAWKIPWTEEPGRLQSMGSLRVGHD